MIYFYAPTKTEDRNKPFEGFGYQMIWHNTVRPFATDTIQIQQKSQSSEFNSSS